MNFNGIAKRLEAVDLPRIGATIGVGEDELRAFMEVEANGRGFDEHGRPKILFEPHIFYKLLGPGEERERAVKEKLAYPKWNRKGYTVDSYTRLQQASEINETIALMSASWGLGQIMGFNHKKAGYPTVQAMVQDFMDDEDNHLEAMVRLLINFKLDDDLRNHNWRKIEDVYNGGGYGGKYADKMEKAFAKWQKISDTPFGRPIDEDVINAASPSDLVKQLQQALNDKGYQAGAVDGKWGKMTRDAVMAFKADNNLDVSDRSVSLSKVIRAKPRAIESRQDATVADLRERGSTTVAGADKVEAASYVAGVGATGYAALDKFELVSGIWARIKWAWEPISEDFGWLLTSPFLYVGALAIVAIYYARKVKAKRLEEFKQGKVQ